MKSALFVIAALLIASVFATAIAIADDSATIEDSAASTQAVSASEIIETETTESDLTSAAADADSIAPSAQAEKAKQRYAGIRRASIVNGFIINEAGTAAESISGIWVSARYIAANKTRPKAESVIGVAAGKISIGTSPNAERFKIVKKEFTNTSVSFYVLPLTQNLAELKDAGSETISSKSVGTLKLDATKYPHLTIWKGTLTLNSGNYAGTWSATAFSHLKEIKAETLKGKAKAAASGEGKKRGFFDIFRRAKNKTASSE